MPRITAPGQASCEPASLIWLIVCLEVVEKTGLEPVTSYIYLLRGVLYQLSYFSMSPVFPGCPPHSHAAIRDQRRGEGRIRTDSLDFLLRFFSFVAR